MKVTIRERVPGRSLADAVPPPYRQAVAEATDPDGVYTLMLFAHDRRDVVPLAAVRRGLRRLSSAAPDGIVLVGTVFTAEARVIAAIQGLRMVTLHDAHWTDESARQRQL